MTQHAMPADLARAFTEAWTSHDMDAAASYLADDVTFDGPQNHSEGAQDYMRFLSGFASSVTSATITTSYGDDSQALIMYEVTNPAGTWTCAELLKFAGGKIQTDTLTFSLNTAR